jgi:dihydrofolate synthase/folylpolyglutamate synthase
LKSKYHIDKEHIREGITKVVTLTGLKGRWQKLNDKPLVICDTAHNEAGIEMVVKQIKQVSYKQLYFVYGVVNDKDLSKILTILPKDAYYYFCKPNIMRGLDAEILQAQAGLHGLSGEVITDVSMAYQTALARAHENDMIFVGGSTFVVAEIV